MSVDRLERVNALIRREIGDALIRVISDTRFDRSLVTVTQVTAARNLRTARVLVSVRGNEAQQQQTISVIRRHRHEIQQAINHDLTLKYTPVLHFELDLSIRKGDRVLDILSHLEPIRQPDDPSKDNPVEA